LVPIRSAVAPSQSTPMPSRSRSTTPTSRPRPTITIPSPTAAESGSARTAAPAASRRTGRETSADDQSASIAKTPAATAATLAPPCTRSARLTDSYGGRGQPLVHGTAPETTVPAALAPSRAAATRVVGGSAAARSASPAASPKIPAR
jgi:hypothetical protein